MRDFSQHYINNRSSTPTSFVTTTTTTTNSSIHSSHKNVSHTTSSPSLTASKKYTSSSSSVTSTTTPTKTSSSTLSFHPYTNTMKGDRNNTTKGVGIMQKKTSLPPTVLTNTATTIGNNNNNQLPTDVTRVYVRQGLIDTVLKNHQSSSSNKGRFKQPLVQSNDIVSNNNSNHNPVAVTKSSFVGKSFVPVSFGSGSSSSSVATTTTPPRDTSLISTSSCSSTQLTAELTQDGSSDTTLGSISNGSTIFTTSHHSRSSINNNNNNMVSPSVVLTPTTTNGRVNLQWEWKEGILLPTSTSSSTTTTPRTSTISGGSTSNTTDPTMITIQLVSNTTTTASGSIPPTTIQVPYSALEVGDVVVANEVSNNGSNSNTSESMMDPNNNNNNDSTVVDPMKQMLCIAPHDLISLTHLHEPAVCIALQQRYNYDMIYTNTGPILLAINPFCTISGLYGEQIQRKYVEVAEKYTNTNTLPPHVYAIADNAFRNMMRSIEDCSDRIVSDNTKKGVSVVDATTTVIKNMTTTTTINQSILISGESGSGKTVTTKFVMKYLAALSQRSVQIHDTAKKLPPERAYIKVQEERNKRKGIGTKNNNDTIPAIELSSNTIEAQVLQSNPILESFGNARTVRNDNSSRFGKFIEIQFTATGKLVGAVLQTYLLEKVRLNYQNYGERNYHIFYELLSGYMSSRELSQYFLASTANPDDFKLTNSSGTISRRDGVSDRETCSGLLSAFQTMKFSKSDVHDVLTVTAAILHASNLTFVDLNNDTCCLDESNVHFYPVCTLLGLTVSDLNQAICHCQLIAGEVNVTRSLSVSQAIIGLESLLKETYGALFQYLVKRINSQMAMVDDERVTAAATIGVLDIFGFESFAVNSFEQLCINYCNEALQQQFNAFVLQNEQAEYEREGIQWSFIEFPENQDVLDLMEKRGAGVLSILDDQCRAPGPSDKAFCLAVYSQCSTKPRFSVTRKQQAMLQFSINHYAGPVEYTVTGFTAKNKDEPPKETILLLRSSSMPLVRELAAILEEALEAPISNDVDASGELRATPVSKRLHRADSSMARPTVGGQFRTQLRMLRQKIDATAPHYIRCLKPNDMLVPDHFDIAIVAEQLKCGGILEAVRVARAGFTQHYSHADFCRRYRALAWKELPSTSSSSSGNSTSTMRSPTPPKWNVPSVVSPKNTAKSVRHSFPVSNFVPKFSSSSPTSKGQLNRQIHELSPTDAKNLCKELLKVLYRKIERHGGVIVENVGAVASSSTETFGSPSPVAKAKSYSFKNPSSTTPSWASKALSPGSPKTTEVRDSPKGPTTTKSTMPTTTTSWKPRGSSSLITGADLARVGIQMGKSKVFLRHKAFEVLERIRGSEQSAAATTLNSMFRRYLARIAYIPYRDAMRQARERQRMMKYSAADDNMSNMEYDDYKEMKEQDYEDYGGVTGDGANIAKRSFQSARSSFYNNSSLHSCVGSDKWTELQIKEAIHNPVPRHEWGKQAPVDATKFKWVIREGLWVKNYNIM